MSSGMDVDAEAVTLFQEMKSNKNTYRCIIFKISDDKKKIEVDRIVKYEQDKDQETEYNEIIKSLPPLEGRYIVWDLKVPNPKSGKDMDKLAFMSWCPDDGPISGKMIFASSKDGLKKKLQGIGTAVDCSDLDDTQYKAVCSKIAHGH